MPTSSDGYLTVTPDNTTGSVLILVNMAAAVPEATINLASSPNTELGAALLAAQTNSSATAVSGQAGVAPGQWVTRMQATAAGSAVCRTVETFAVRPGKTYTGSYHAKAVVTGRSVQLAIVWFNAAGAVVSTSVPGASVADSTAGYVRPFVTAVAPATAVGAKIEVTVLAAAASEQHYWDGLQFAELPNLTAYTDGYQDGARWAGAAVASMSVRPPYNRVTVRRADGTIVRGLDQAQAPAGQVEGIDHEAPRGVAQVYTATVTNGISSISTTTATATIAAVAGRALIKSLRTPSLSYAFLARKMPDWSRSIQQGVARVLSSQYPKVSSGLRQARTGVLEVLLATAADEAALTALIEAIGPMLIQFPAEWREPDRYFAIGDVDMSRLVRAAVDPYRAVELPLIEVARPSTTGAAVAIPGHTYADSAVAWPLYSNRNLTYADR